MNGQPVSDASFVTAFWEVHDALVGAHSSLAVGDQCRELEALPGYFRLVLLVGLWLFAKEGVDVAIMEVTAHASTQAPLDQPHPVGPSTRRLLSLVPTPHKPP